MQLIFLQLAKEKGDGVWVRREKTSAHKILEGDSLWNQVKGPLKKEEGEKWMVLKGEKAESASGICAQPPRGGGPVDEEGRGVPQNLKKRATTLRDVPPGKMRRGENSAWSLRQIIYQEMKKRFRLNETFQKEAR